MDLYGAQRTNFKPAVPRVSTRPGMTRRAEVRSRNRGKRDVANALPMPDDPVKMMLAALQRKTIG